MKTKTCRAGVAGLALMMAILHVTAAAAQGEAAKPATPDQPWRNTGLPADQRAELVLAQMTLEDKIQLVHGTGRSNPASNGGAGFVPGIARLGLPDLNMADAAVGVAHGGGRGRYATLMPSGMSEASGWDLQLAYDYGALVGRELRDQGFNTALSGGVNLLREPRNGRGFEYLSEDPVLAGKLVGQSIRGIQAQHVIGTIKHYALNDQETGRQVLNVAIAPRDMRESDLLAFEIGVKEGQPGMVMCSYNKVNGDWSCENDDLLTKVLKQEWGFKGFVLSDWGGTHSSAKAALAGLDQEQPGQAFFGDALRADIAAGRVPAARLDDMVRRILRSEFANGLVDTPPVQRIVDIEAGLEVSQRVAEAGAVLLKNEGILPLAAGFQGAILVVGGHADVGVPTGGGSAQVDPPGGNAVPTDSNMQDLGAAGVFQRGSVWYPSSPLKTITATFTQAKVSFDAGTDPAAAAKAARSADVVILFATQTAGESGDQRDLSLSGNQNALIEAVSAANPRTVVVLETGGPVTMPWVDQAKGVVELWYPGARGGPAIANLLAGSVDFRGRLPVTFPRSEADLPLPVLVGSDLKPVPDTSGAGRRPSLPPFEVKYPEGSKVGYKWFDARQKTPLFPFGHGLSYTSFAFSHASATQRQVTFTVTNTGARAGNEVAQVYAGLPDATEAPRRLVGWVNVPLEAGESKAVSVRLEPLLLSTFDPAGRRWVQPDGRYRIYVGGSSRDLVQAGSFEMKKDRVAVSGRPTQHGVGEPRD